MQQPSHVQFTSAVPVAVPARVGARQGLAWRLCRGLVTLLQFPSRVAAIRRDMALLGAMDDRSLSDIGLTRQDLRDAGALPASEHPGTLFRDRVESRRRRRAPERMR